MALIQHYIEDSPLTEVAQQLGTNTNALAVRLQRGKLALRRFLTQEMQPEFIAYRQITDQATWEVTPLWCYRCGKQRLLGKRVSREGKLLLKCPVCSPGEHQMLHRSELPLLQGMKSYKPMLTRSRHWSHEHYRLALAALFAGRNINCETCGQPLIVLFAPLGQLPTILQDALLDVQWLDQGKLVNTFCSRCQTVCSTSLTGLALALPEVRSFVHAQSSIHTLPPQSLETEGRRSLLTRFESVTGNAALNVISDEETYDVLRIEKEGC